MSQDHTRSECRSEHELFDVLVRIVTWQHCERTTSLTSKSYLTVTIQFKGWQLTNAPACEREVLLAEPIFECRISSEEEDEMAALLENQNFEHAQDYIRRGRNLVGVPTPELKARWEPPLRSGPRIGAKS